MAQIALAIAGNAIAPGVGGIIGNIVGGFIDNAVFGNGGQNQQIQATPRLEELNIQVSTYGSPIPIAYGRNRMAGNVIWSRPIREVVITETQSAGGKGGGGGGSVTTTSYEYYVTLAIAICEGEIDEIVRVWADSNPLDATTLQNANGKYEIHLGSETQSPSTIMESYEGSGEVPAYRGAAYVVIEDFPLAEYGNRIPNFTFEVIRSLRPSPSVEDKIKSITIIPGSGEFVYSDTVQEKYEIVTDANGLMHRTGKKTSVNMHNFESRANMLLSLDALEKALPNLEWVSIVVNWFITSKDMATGVIVPKTEFLASESAIEPDTWSVGSYTRTNTDVVESFPDGSPTYGGTPSDESLFEIIQACKAKGWSVMLYPMPLVDTVDETAGEDDKPWRGRLVPTSESECNTWFTQSEGYNDFVRHYSQLTVGGTHIKTLIDAFVIGSELVGITTYDMGDFSYPGVANLKTLAGLVVSDLSGGSVLLTYAADWSEYHSINGYYHLDDLWTDSNIDFVGIDAYFPLTEDLPQSQITESLIQQYWEDGEGWDYYYADSARTTQVSYGGDPTYAWKNNENWWNSVHTHWSTNIMNAPEDLTNAAWTKANGTATGNTVDDLRGNQLADTFTEDTSTGEHYFDQTDSNDTTDTYRFYAEVKDDGRDTFKLHVFASGSANSFYAFFDLSAGTVAGGGAIGDAVLIGSNIADKGNGWYEVYIEGQPSAATNTGTVRSRLGLRNAGSGSYTGDGSSGVHIGYVRTVKMGQTSGWTAKMKPVWFTEYGFPSVDGAANQPNVFVDPTSVESYYPRGSRQRIDFKAQREAINATEDFLATRNAVSGNSDLVPRRFVWTWDARPFPFFPDLLGIWSDGNNWKTGHWIQGKIGISHLGSIVNDILSRCGLDSSDYDTSALTDLVDGFIIDANMPARGAIESLQQAYFFDAVETNGQIKFVKRGGDIAYTINEDDLVPVATDDLRETVSITRGQDIELPQKVTVNYINRVAGFLKGSQISQRQSVKTVNQIAFDMPIVLSDQEAKIIADQTLFSQWVSRTRYRFMLSSTYARVEPTDRLEINVNGVTHAVRVVDTSLSRNGVSEITAVADDVSTYDFYTQPGSVTSAESAGVISPETNLVLLDLPPLPNDTDNGAGILRAAMAGENDEWKGAALYRSDDGGVSGGNSFTRVDGTTTEAIIGTLLNNLAAGATNNFDGNTIDVSLISGSLSSVTELALLNGANSCVIGDEIIQFQYATLTGNNRYTLSKLLRGRLGTDHAMAHTAGEEFVLLNSALLEKQIAVNNFGLLKYYKAVTSGQLLANADEESFTYTGKMLKPFSPVHITGSRDGSSNLTIDWIRRTRIGGEWRDNVDVPLSEESEQYEVDIMDGSDVVRTISVTSPQASYTAAQQTSDFGSTQSSVTIKIYQISAIIGRGYPGEATI